MQALRAGGTDGNEQLTALTGALLLALLAVLGCTILMIGRLIWLHLFLGLLLIGPVALKLASTGYRFVRYYAGEPAYVRKGPPQLWLRLIAPLVVLSTVVVFASGVLLMLQDPRDRGVLFTAHKLSFIVWVGATGLHVLGHLRGLPASLRAVHRGAGAELGIEHGRLARWVVLVGALVAGVVLALALIPEFAQWTQHGALSHHRRG